MQDCHEPRPEENVLSGNGGRDGHGAGPAGGHSISEKVGEETG